MPKYAAYPWTDRSQRCGPSLLQGDTFGKASGMVLMPSSSLGSETIAGCVLRSLSRPEERS